jgi:CubicO group peptidase (beta-lactamase class C family)
MSADSASQQKMEQFFQACFATNETQTERNERLWSTVALKSMPAIDRLKFFERVRADLGELELVETAVDGKRVLGIARAEDGKIYEVALDWGLDGLDAFSIRDVPKGTSFQAPRLSDTDFGKEIAKVFEREASEGFSGAVRISRGGQVLFEQAFGLADRTRNIKNTTNTLFAIGSVNKLFTKVAAAQLISAGTLGLDDPIERWIPDYPNRDAALKVRVRHLLDMTSGIGDFFGPAFDATDKRSLRHNNDYVSLFASDALAFEPGSQTQYSNGGYVLLGVLIERASGQDYYEYVREHIYRPAGMKSADSYTRDANTPDLAVGYTSADKETEGLRDATPMHGARGSASGGGYATLADLQAFAIALEDGSLIPGPVVDWFLSESPAPDVWPFEVRPPRGGGRLGMVGGAEGMNALLALDGKRDLVIIILSNLDPPSATRPAEALLPLIERLNPKP